VYPQFSSERLTTAGGVRRIRSADRRHHGWLQNRDALLARGRGQALILCDHLELRRPTLCRHERRTELPRIASAQGVNRATLH
jgi:hypothetical protein